MKLLVVLVLSVVVLLTRGDVPLSDQSDIPVRVFLSLRNITEEAALSNLREKKDVGDLEASASDTISTDDGNSTRRNSRGTEGGVDQSEEPSLSLPFKHKRIDTAELSDCALQGDWHPIGAPGHQQYHHHHLQEHHEPLVTNQPHHGPKITSHGHLISSLQHHGSVTSHGHQKGYHQHHGPLIPNVHHRVPGHREVHLTPPPVSKHINTHLASNFLSPPPVPLGFYAEKPIRPQHSGKKGGRPLVHATVSHVPVSQGHYHSTAHTDGELGSFTCGKNHDHGTNFHTATFQVVGDEEAQNLDGLRHDFAEATHPHDVAVSYQHIHDVYPPENRQSLQDELIVSFPSGDSHDLREVAVPAESAQQVSALPVEDQNLPYNPWNDQYDSTTVSTTNQPVNTQVVPEVNEDQEPEPNAHSYFYEIEKVHKYPKPATSGATVQGEEHQYTEPDDKKRYSSFSPEHNEIIKEIEQFSNDLNQKYEGVSTGFPSYEDHGATQAPSQGSFADVHSQFHQHDLLDDFHGPNGLHENLQNHPDQQHHLVHHHHSEPVHHYDHEPVHHHHQEPVHFHNEPQQQNYNEPILHAPPYVPSQEYKKPYVPPPSPHPSSYEAPAHVPSVAHDPYPHLLGTPVFHHNSHHAVFTTTPHKNNEQFAKVHQGHVNCVSHGEPAHHHHSEAVHHHHPESAPRPHAERLPRFQYTVQHQEVSTSFPETQPVFTKEPVRLPLGVTPRPGELKFFHAIKKLNQDNQPESFFHFNLNKNSRNSPISAHDVETPPHSKPKVHKTPKRTHPTRPYEVHEHSGERHRPLAEIFPPKKMPKQFHNRTPNFAVGRPKKGNKPSKGTYVSTGTELKAVLHPPVQSKHTDRQKVRPSRVVKKVPSGKGPITDKTVKVTSSLDPTKQQMLARVVEFSRH